MHATTPLTLLACLTISCGAPVVKHQAFASEILERAPLPADLLRPAAHDELEVMEDPQWLSDVQPLEALTFAGIRSASGTSFALLLECDPAADQLTALPLSPAESPLDALADPARRAELRAVQERYSGGERLPELLRLSIVDAIAGRTLAPPLPTPRRIFAAAANYPSHLQADMVAGWSTDARTSLTASRPRVFLKHPASAPPGHESAADLGFQGVVGPYDGIQHPRTITVPLGPDGAPVSVELRLDYEVELGVVFTRTLTPESVASATDAELRAAVGGYLLVSDAKARNPAAATRILGRGEEPPAGYEPYRPDHDRLEERLGRWGPEICAWWSYGASFGNFSALGPFLVAAPEDGSLPPRAMLSARSYAGHERRGLEPPDGLRPDVLYLRQCSRTTTRADFEDALVWDVPAIVRSILAADGVIPFPGSEPRISVGDVLCLGTPGGAVITAPDLPAFVPWMLFWWDPIDWHDKFFGRDAEHYLREGDRVFYWVEGLGYQLHEVEPTSG